MDTWHSSHAPQSATMLFTTQAKHRWDNTDIKTVTLYIGTGHSSHLVQSVKTLAQPSTEQAKVQLSKIN